MDLVGALITLGIILCAVIAHELMHGCVAYWLGDTTAKENGRLTLNPLKHIDPIMSIAVPMLLYLIGAPIIGGAKPVPVNSQRLKWGAWGMALVAVAGPLTNLVLAFIGFLIYRFCGYNEWALSFVSVNLGFTIFNLIPIPPLDGSRVLYAIVPDAVRNFMLKIEPYGIWIIYGLILIFSSAFSGFIITIQNAIWQFFIFITGG